MRTDIAQYINSGVLEVYITGAATPAEESEIKQLQQQYPEVKQALQQLEHDFERLAGAMAIQPPPAVWHKIEVEIDGLIARGITMPQPAAKHGQHDSYDRQDNASRYIEVEGESRHMRIHKNWKWVLATIFILGKIFLACAIFFYLENRQSQQQIQELKQEVRELRQEMHSVKK